MQLIIPSINYTWFL